MLGLLNKLFDSNNREIKKLDPIISEINGFEKSFSKLKDQDFSKRTKSFRERIEKGESLDLILPEAFALVRDRGGAPSPGPRRRSRDCW